MEIESLVRIMKATAGAHQLRPWLVGPSGSGKTARVRAAAEQLGYDVEVLLLGTMMPEDVLGLPRVLNGVTRWTMPEWAVRAQARPTVVFLDELDKAREETISTVLTLMWELRVREVQLRPDTIVCCASQPITPALRGTETGKALIERTFFLPVAPQPMTVGGKRMAEVVKLLGADYSHEQLPITNELSARRADLAADLISRLPDEEARLVLLGMLPAKVADSVLENMASSSSFITRALKKDPVKVMKSAASARVAALQLHQLFAPGIPVWVPVAAIGVLPRLESAQIVDVWEQTRDWIDALPSEIEVGVESDTPDILATYVRRLHDFLRREIEETGGIRELTDAVASEIVQAIVDGKKPALSEGELIMVKS